ncbi:MAG: diphosphomevalonate decarboxylase [Candidatus Peribacteraceae bacterium]|nr:diphosphomevalonate decarboxylase [Candidatus Peribacteraceae bacterium]
MSKATAIAPTNIAFIKYMGRKDEALRLPENASVSMNLSNLLTTTTVEFSQTFRKDTVTINNEEREVETVRVIKHLDRIRKLAKINDRAKVVSSNNFPTGTGLSSSSSGFAALTVAGAKAAGLDLSERELSILARQGSGSASRSIPDGFVEWVDADSSEESYAKTIFPADHWDILDVVAIVSTGRKAVKSSTAHQSVASGPYYRARIDRMAQKVQRCKKLIAAKDFPSFGALCEEEALDLHVIFMSAGIIYLTSQSLELIKLVPLWRNEGLPVYFTLNTGQDVHLLCEQQHVTAVQKKLKRLECVREVIVNEPARGARVTGEQLF